MCTLFIAHAVNEHIPLLVAFTRDERFDRPTQTLHKWKDKPVLGGRDEECGGTWFGMNGNRFAALTNYPKIVRENAESRGHLVTGFLEAQTSPDEYLQMLKTSRAHLMSGFHFVAGEAFRFTERDPVRWKLSYFCNAQENIHSLSPGGVYGISNETPGESWDKITFGRNYISDALSSKRAMELPEILHSLMEEQRESESIFTPYYSGYGTRSTTVMLGHRDGSIYVSERTYDINAEVINKTSEIIHVPVQFSESEIPRPLSVEAFPIRI